MLAALGLGPTTERIYRQMLTKPHWGIDELSAHTNIGEADVRNALDQLFELALVRDSVDTPGALHVISPKIALQAAVTRQQAELARRQQEVAESQAAISQLLDEFASAGETSVDVISLTGIDPVRDRLAQLAAEVQTEVLTFMPGGAQSPEALRHARDNDMQLLERGVRVRTVGLSSLRHDPATVAHAKFLTDNGAEFRTYPVLPPRMILADRRVALVPIDPNDTRRGALCLTGTGIVASLLALFDQVWELATPLGSTHQPDRQGLSEQQRALLGLLAQGMTDEAAAARLGVSHRTVRRMMADLMDRLQARSRFEAGLKIVQQGWL